VRAALPRAEPAWVEQGVERVEVYGGHCPAGTVFFKMGPAGDERKNG